MCLGGRERGREWREMFSPFLKFCQKKLLFPLCSSFSVRRRSSFAVTNHRREAPSDPVVSDLPFSQQVSSVGEAFCFFLFPFSFSFSASPSFSPSSSVRKQSSNCFSAAAHPFPRRPLLRRLFALLLPAASSRPAAPSPPRRARRPPSVPDLAPASPSPSGPRARRPTPRRHRRAPQGRRKRSPRGLPPPLHASSPLPSDGSRRWRRGPTTRPGSRPRGRRDRRLRGRWEEERVTADMERGESFFRLVEVETSAALVSVDLPRALAEEAQALL